MYCPKCKSRLFPDDEKYIQAAGVCGYCVTYDTTPDKRFQKAAANQPKKKAKKQQIASATD